MLMRTLAAALVVAVLALVPARTACAAFHLMHITEVMSGFDGDPDVQYVELQMETSGQNQVTDTRLTAFNEDGSVSTVLLLTPSSVPVGSQPLVNILYATAEFEAETGFAPDFIFPAGILPASGMVCWGAPFGLFPPPPASWDPADPNNYIDCLAYGDYTGPTHDDSGTPTSLPAGDGMLALVRVADTDDNATDFALQGPGPCRNSFLGSPECTFLGESCGNGNIDLDEECDGETGCFTGVCLGNCVCLEKEETKCASGFIKSSAKVLGAYGKAAAKCVKDFGTGKTSADPATCVSDDPKDKLQKARSKVDAGIDKFCSVPYAMDCPEPCDATDAGGATLGIDDDDELKACLQCLNPAISWSGAQPLLFKGVHGTILDGVTLATAAVDADLAKCQALLVKAYEKLFQTKAKLLAGCTKKAFKTGGDPADCIGANPKGKITKAIGKLEKAVSKCKPSPTVPLDAGACAGLSTDPPAGLTSCLDVVIECKYCRWANVVTGAAADCDLLDDAVANASCQ